MLIELEDTARTGFQFVYDTVDDLVEVDLTQDGETCQIAELTLEQADRWRTGKARLFRASGFVEPLAAGTVMAPDASADDCAWLKRIGIAVER